MTENADAESIDAIVAALYECISGAAGEPRDWEREKRLLFPGARLMPARPEPGGGAAADVFDLEGYIASRAPLFEKNAFYETEIERRAFRFGSIAHVLSSYELRRAPGEKPFQRGINSIQLFHDGRRWWVMSILWDNERPGHPLPALG